MSSIPALSFGDLLKQLRKCTGMTQGDLAGAHTHLQEAVTVAATFEYQEMLRLWQPLLGLVTLYEENVQ